jgi:hypothetical protein
MEPANHTILQEISLQETSALNPGIIARGIDPIPNVEICLHRSATGDELFPGATPYFLRKVLPLQWKGRSPSIPYVKHVAF